MWDTLTLKQKSDVMKMAIQQGISDLNEIKRLYNTSSNKFSDGGYTRWKDAIRAYKGIDPDMDRTYDYEGFYKENPREAWNMLSKDSSAHFTDKYKTIEHPTFSDQSKYSGVYSKFNPTGLQGGRWDRNRFIMSPDLYKAPVSMDERIDYLSSNEDEGVQLRESDGSLPLLNDGSYWGGVLPNVEVKEPNQLEEYRKFINNGGLSNPISYVLGNREYAEGGPLGNIYKGNGSKSQKMTGWRSSDSIRKRISNWEGASMYSPAPDTGKVNRPFEEEDTAFWNTIPSNIRGKLTQEMADALFSTSYNIGSGNFKKRVVPNLVKLFNGEGTLADVQKSMYGTRDYEPKMEGLRRRRAWEREAFGNAYTKAYRNIPKVMKTPVPTIPSRGTQYNPVKLPEMVITPTETSVNPNLTKTIERFNPFNNDNGPFYNYPIADIPVYNRHQLVTPELIEYNITPSDYILFGNTFAEGGPYVTQADLDRNGWRWAGRNELIEGDPLIGTLGDDDDKWLVDSKGILVPTSTVKKWLNSYERQTPYQEQNDINTSREVESSQQHRKNEEFNRQVDNFFGGNFTRPSQIVGAFDPHNQASNIPFIQRLLLGTGNTGLVSQQYMQEHPYMGEGLNLVFDFSMPSAIKGMPEVYSATRYNPYMLSRAMNSAAKRYSFEKPSIFNSKSHSRFKLGDVEIDNPALYYRQGDSAMGNNFLTTGVVSTDEVEFNNPMYKVGGLWYGKPTEAKLKGGREITIGKFNLTKRNEASAKTDLLVSGPETEMIPANAKGGPQSWIFTKDNNAPFSTKEMAEHPELADLMEEYNTAYYNGEFTEYSDVVRANTTQTRRIPASKGAANSFNTTLYRFKPGYGYKKVSGGEEVLNLFEKPLINKNGDLNVSVKEIIERVRKEFPYAVNPEELINKGSTGRTNLIEHIEDVVKSAQEYPLPKGVSRQDFVTSALIHDLGKMLTRGQSHGLTSTYIIDELNIPINQSVRNAVSKHMNAQSYFDSTNDVLEKALHAADVGRGTPYLDLIEKYPYLKYLSE